MDQYEYYDIPQDDEEDESGIDIIGLLKGIWDGRKTIIIVTVIFMALGLVAALTMKRTYTVSTVMVPQMNSRSSSSLSSLASLAGFDLGTSNMSGGELSPLVYPQIVSSVPFRMELMNTPLHYAKADTAVSMFTYTKEYLKPSPMSYVLKYTIGLPGVILNSLRKEKPEVTLPEDDSDDTQILVLTKDEAKVMRMVAKNVNLSVDKKEGFITLTVTGSEPLQTAELALKAQTLLQSEVTRFRTEKAQAQLDYIQARYNEIKAEAEYYQSQLATVKDRSQQMTTTRSKIEQERIQNKYNVANSIYGEMAKQLEQAKMQVKRDTPVLAVIQPVTVPIKPSNSRAKKLIVWTFLGLFFGIGFVLGKSLLPKIKESFAENEEVDNSTTEA